MSKKQTRVCFGELSPAYASNMVSSYRQQGYWVKYDAGDWEVLSNIYLRKEKPCRLIRAVAILGNTLSLGKLGAWLPPTTTTDGATKSIKAYRERRDPGLLQR